MEHQFKRDYKSNGIQLFPEFLLLFMAFTTLFEPKSNGFLRILRISLPFSLKRQRNTAFL